MASKVHTEFTSDGKQLLKTIQDSQKEIERLTNENRNLRDISKRASKEAADGLKSVKEGAMSAADATDLLNEGLALTSDLLKQVAERQDKVAGTQRSAADAQRAFLRNLGNVSESTRQSAITQIAAIGERTGVRQSMLFDAASTAMSARGATDPVEALRAVEMAARVAPESVGEMSSFAGALLDAKSLTKQKDMEANLGFLVGMQGQARVTTLGQVAQNLVPGAIGVQGYGGTPAEAGALVTTLTQAMKDATGATSSTAAIQLAKQLEEFKATAKIEGGTDDRIRALQQNESLRTQFLEKASFDAKAGIPVRELLTPGTETAKLFEQNIGGIPSGRAAVDEARRFLAGINAPDLQRAAAFERRSEQEIENLQIDDFRSGDASRIRRRVDSLLVESGAHAPSMPWTLGWVGGRDPLDTAEQLLRGRSGNIRMFGGEDYQTAAAAKMDALIEEIRGLRQDAALRNLSNHGAHIERQ